MTSPAATAPAASASVISPPPASTTDNHPLPGWVCAVIGGISGTIEVCVNQPTVSWKNALQQGRPISFNPAIMYRGTFINASSIAPITAIQFGVAGILTELIAGKEKRELTNNEKMATSLGGGAVSALVVCPADMLIIQQQKTGLSLIQQIKAISSEYGFSKFSKGFLPAVGRESLFVGGYLGLAPILRQLLIETYPAYFADNSTHASNTSTSSNIKAKGNMASLIVSGMMAGVTAGVLTHPIDTIKTRMQGDLTTTSPYKTMRGTAAILWQEGGIGRFFQGVAPRTGRICIAVCIFNECNRIFSDWFRKAGY